MKLFFSHQFVTHNLGLTNPLDEYPFYIVIETSGSDLKHDEEKLNSFLEHIMTEGIVVDGTVATEPSKIQVLKRCTIRFPDGVERFVRVEFIFAT